ncbi:MAG: hemolysin family protein [Chlamydiales bacterium]|nr:hemolysin family protein [Chlamydiales bacterium]
MSSEATFWFVLTFSCIMTEAFFSGMEMAIVSFNKVRLQYYVAKGYKRAQWLNWLLQHPSRLFGTTLLGVNIAMQLGSECSRQLYEALDLKAEFAPLTQVFLVLICAELAPNFAGRRYSVSLGMLGVPLVYAAAKIMTPIIWIIAGISKLANRLVGGQERQNRLFLSRDELLTVIEDHSDEPKQEGEELNVLVRNIFSLRNKIAGDVMEPMNAGRMISAHATIGQMGDMLKDFPAPFVPVYQRSINNIVGIAIPRDYIKAPSDQRVGTLARSPWFITQETTLVEILHQFRSNNQSVAVVLDKPGRAVGILTLDDLLEEVFGKFSETLASPYLFRSQKILMIDKNFPGDMKITDFNAQFGVYLDPQDTETLAELMHKVLGHPPADGESIYLEPFRLTVKKSNLLGAKTITVKTEE